MGIIYLRDVMETRYIINALAMRFRRCMDDAIANGNTVDLAGCRFGPDCANMLNEYYDKVPMQNSEEPECDAIIKNNIEYKTGAIEEYEPLVIDHVDGADVFLDLYNNLPQGGQYKVECSLIDIKCRATLVLLIMTRSDLELDIRQCASDVYDFVRNTWLGVAEHHDKYYELLAPNTVIREMTEDGYFGDRSYGYQKEQTFIRNRIVLPFEFGNTQLVNLGQSEQMQNEWQYTAEMCLKVLQPVTNERRSGKVLRNLLTFRED